MSSIYDKSSLVLIPSGTKSGKVFSQKPVNGDGDFTFSRSTAATRVNASGNIEKETQNLLLQSNSFTTGWDKSSEITLTSGQAGYDGSNNAWLMSKNSATTYRFIGRSSISHSGVQTASVYAKAGTLSILTLYAGGGINPFVEFDLSAGSIVNQRSGVIDSTITDVGNGWYRCTMTFNDPITFYQIYPDWDLTNTGNLYIQDAQLNQGLIAQEVITTTTAAVEGGITDNVPRLDYTDSSCPALLLEPQRSNLLVQSEYYSTTPYSRVNASVTHNDTTSPEGVVNAVKLESSSNGSASRVETFPTFADNTIYTASIFAKQGNVDYIMVNVRDKNNVQHNTYFDLSDGTKGSSNGSPISTSIEAVGDYYRVSITIDSSSGGTTPRLQYLIANTDNNVVTASGEYIYIYGAQLEAGSYATSYIPTYGTSVTRNADESKVAYNAIAGLNEATLVVEYEIPIEQPSGLNHIAGYRDNANADFYILQLGNSNNHELRWRGQNGTQTSLVAAIDEATYGLHRKIAFVKTNDKLIAYCNGVKVSETSAGATNAFSTNASEELDLWYSGFVESKPIKQLLVIPSALSNQEAIDLTTI